jgi:23S rRNA (adenine2503-C2)-methyltransferase
LKPILSLTFEELKAELKDLSESSFRAQQIYEWLYEKGVSDFSEMSNLSKELREKLSQTYFITKPKQETFTSTDGTVKYQFILDDDKRIESVWIPETSRNTLCISSQVGCALKCAFCVTGAIGFSRNLTADEIVAEVRAVRLLDQRPVSNIVFMGMGEPLLNVDNVVKAIEVLTDHKGIAIGKRKITVSTAGMVPKIKEFVQRSGVRLAISLTGTNDEARDYWMPINKKYNLATLSQELRSLNMGEGRHVMFEVVMIRDQTDRMEQAKELVSVLKGIPAKVNLIPYNENEFFPDLKQPDQKDVLAFQNYLLQHGIRTMIRKNRGRDIMAACGQLAGQKVS